MKFNPGVKAQFDVFYSRDDTFSLGVCNGCQLMALLGWIAPLSEGSGNHSNQIMVVKQNIRICTTNDNLKKKVKCPTKIS